MKKLYCKSSFFVIVLQVLFFFLCMFLRNKKPCKSLRNIFLFLKFALLNQKTVHYQHEVIKLDGFFIKTVNGNALSVLMVTCFIYKSSICNRKLARPCFVRHLLTHRGFQRIIYTISARILGWTIKPCA